LPPFLAQAVMVRVIVIGPLAVFTVTDFWLSMMFNGVPTAKLAACPKARLDKLKLSRPAKIFFMNFSQKPPVRGIAENSKNASSFRLDADQSRNGAQLLG
jgi:hypothetical protein